MSKELIAVRQADARWEGTLKEGRGRVAFGGFDEPYTFESRFASGDGTTPEALLGAAHAACFTMATSAQLTNAGHKPGTLKCSAKVTLAKGDGGAGIDQIELVLAGNGEGFTLDDLRTAAEAAKTGCPLSKALAAVPTISLSVSWLD